MSAEAPSSKRKRNKAVAAPVFDSDMVDMTVPELAGIEFDSDDREAKRTRAVDSMENSVSEKIAGAVSIETN
jgi:hypothetical protein